MPAPIDPSLLMSAGQTAQANANDIFNAFSTLATNVQGQMFSKGMYKRQRADALEFWGMQNDYNSPASQVARLKAAGLNPAFAFGGNAGGGSQIQVPDVTPVNFREPRLQGSPRMDPLMFADLRIKNAQANNLETQTEVIRQDAELRRFQALRTGLDYRLENELFTTNADARRANLRKTQVETDLAIRRDAREVLMTSSNLREAVERMATMEEERLSMQQGRAKSRQEIYHIQAQIKQIHKNLELMDKEGITRDWENELRTTGVGPNTPWYAQLFGSTITRLLRNPQDGGSLKKLSDDFKSTLRWRR